MDQFAFVVDGSVDKVKMMEVAHLFQLGAACNRDQYCFSCSDGCQVRPFEDANGANKGHYYNGDLLTESCLIDEWKHIYCGLDKI